MKRIIITIISLSIIATFAVVFVTANNFRDNISEEEVSEMQLQRKNEIYKNGNYKMDDFETEYYLDMKYLYSPLQVNDSDTEEEAADKERINEMIHVLHGQIDDLLNADKKGQTVDEHEQRCKTMGDILKSLSQAGYHSGNFTSLEIITNAINDVDSCLEIYNLLYGEEHKTEWYYKGRYDETKVEKALDYQSQMREMQQKIENGEFENETEAYNAATALRKKFLSYAYQIMDVPM